MDMKRTIFVVVLGAAIIAGLGGGLLAGEKSSGKSPSPAEASRLKLPKGKATVAIPVERGQNFLFTKVRINGQDAGYFLVDTGSNYITVDTGVADSLKLPDKGPLSSFGVGEGQKTHVREIRSFSIGDASLTKDLILSRDLGHFSRLYGLKFSGILEPDLWKQSPFTIDRQASTILRSGALRASCQGASRSAEVHGGSPCCEE